MIGGVLDDAIDGKLSAYVTRAEHEALAAKLERIESEMPALKNGVSEFKKEVYTLKDVAKILPLEVSTIRKNYVGKGKIDATKNGKSWEVSRSEYHRVMDVVNTRGARYL